LVVNNSSGFGRLLNLLKCEVNKQNRLGSTALMLASWQGQDKVVALLLDSGADVQQVDDLEDRAFHLAPSGNERTAKLLVNAGADVNRLDGFGIPPLCLAVEQRFEEVDALLLDLKADVNAQDLNFQNTALHLAFKDGNDKLIKLLIDAGADVTKQNAVGQIALDMRLREPPDLQS
jgi:ankyrin repeat protein